MTPTSLASNATQSSGPTIKNKVLIVGATGFLGSKILQQLQQNNQVSVRAMSRRGAPSSATHNIEWVRGDLMNPHSLDQALQGVDVVVSSANGYMKETIEADFAGNKNLIEAAARAGVKRFVFLSIVACDKAPAVPHFHAKKVAEDLIKATGMPYVLVRAPAFLDQSEDYVADGVNAGRFVAVGDKTTAWSYILSDDLAQYLAQTATYPNDEINYQTIDVGWRDGAKSQEQMVELISQITGKKLSFWTIPWFVFKVLVKPVRLFSELAYDLIQMFLFFKTGHFVANIKLQEKFFGTAPSAKEAVKKWALLNHIDLK